MKFSPLELITHDVQGLSDLQLVKLIITGSSLGSKFILKVLMGVGAIMLLLGTEPSTVGRVSPHYSSI